MAPQNRLGTLFCCEDLWNNIRTYADPNGLGLLLPHNVIVLHTRSNPVQALIPLPSGQTQASAIDALWGWFLAHAMRTPPAMTSEPSVQDEVHTQILEPLNLLLKVFPFTIFCKHGLRPISGLLCLYGQ